MAALIKPPLVIVGLGTSLMSGPLCTPDRDWTRELVLRLRTHSTAKGDVKFINLGRGSQTSDYGVTRIADIVGLKPDLLLCESFAVNDCAIGPVSLIQAETNLNSIVDSVQAESPNTRIALMTESKAWSGDTNRTQKGLYEEQARDIAEAQAVDLIDCEAAWPDLTAGMTVNGDMLHPRWRASPDGPAFDTYSFPVIFDYCLAFMQEKWG